MSRTELITTTSLLVFAIGSVVHAQNPLKITHQKIHERLKTEWAKKIQPFAPMSKADGVAHCDDIRLTKPVVPGVFAKGSLRGISQDFWFITKVNGQTIESPEAFSAAVADVTPGETYPVEGRFMVPGVTGKKRPTWSYIRSEAFVDSALLRVDRGTKTSTDDVEKYIVIIADGADMEPFRLRVIKENEKAVPRLMIDFLVSNDEWVFPTVIKVLINDTLFEFKTAGLDSVRRNTARMTYEAWVFEIDDRPDFIEAILNDPLTKTGTVRFDGKNLREDRSISFEEVTQSRDVINAFYRDRFGE